MKAIAVILGVACAAPAVAQSRYDAAGRDADQPLEQAAPVEATDTQSTQAGHTASTSVGTVGERRTAAQPIAGNQPLQRINTRIQNRVQNRVRNRIDRNYDPQANANSPFLIAGDQVERTDRPGRR